MAKNRSHGGGYEMIHSYACTHPTTPASGDPVRIGEMTGVATCAKGAGGNVAANTSVDIGDGVWDLAVGGVDGSGNSAVAIGDRLYYTDADTPVINKKATGRPFGFALGTVASGGTGTIAVRHCHF